MILQIFCIFDSKAQVFNTPFYMKHQADAVRACIEVGSDPSTTPGKYPEDFSLFYLGTFDDSTGRHELTLPASLGVVASFLRPTNNHKE